MCETPNPKNPDVRPVFIVRFWWEPSGEAAGLAGEWRGSVERLASGQRRFFHRVEDIGAIIADQLPGAPVPPRGPPGTPLEVDRASNE